MSESSIKEALGEYLKQVRDIDLDHIFIDEPDTAPTAEQCPCLVVTLPRITPSMPTHGVVKSIYHFKILYLYAPYELAQPQTATTAISSYLTNMWDVLFSVFTLGANANTQDFDGDVTRPLVRFREMWFWGLEIPWRVEDRETVTVTP